MTLSTPEKLLREMQKDSEKRRSEVARRTFEKKIKELQWMDKTLKHSTISEREANKIGHGIKNEILKRFSNEIGY